MKTNFFSKIALGSVLFMLSHIGVSQAGVPGREPLTKVEILQLSTSVLRATVTLNPLLPPDHDYNIGVFAAGKIIMSNCNNYSQFNGCYFPNVTTSSTTTFLLLGDFTDGWRFDKYAIIVALSAPSPEALAKPGLGPLYTKDFAGIQAPLNMVATVEYFPFVRISG